MLVALEGLDGVGKTTLGKRVAKCMHGTYIKSPPPEMDPVRGFVAEALDSRSSFYFYLSSLYLIQSSIASALEHGLVIVDRYLDSTIAYHDFGRNFNPPAFDRAAIRAPDLTLVIVCPEDARQHRIAARGLHIFDRQPSDEKAIARYLLERADRVFENSTDVDQSTVALTALIQRSMKPNSW